MAEQAHPSVTLAELENLLEAADPGAIFIPPRILRRVIRQQCRLPGLGLQVPHRKSYVIDRETLFQIARREELGLAPKRDLPSTVLLLARPDPEKLAPLPRGPVLVKYWRLLFHARVHVLLGKCLAEEGSQDRGMSRRIARIGDCEFDEIRTVLQEERFLLPPTNDRMVYEEFATLYLELSYFAPSLLPRYFPALADSRRIRELLAEDLDVDQLFAATRLAGAPDPMPPVEDEASADRTSPEPVGKATPLAPATVRYGWWIARADRAGKRGNLVRAAIARQHAAAVALLQHARATQAGAVLELDRLARRLGKALELDEAATKQWRQVLPALLPHAARGLWPVEARLLYDLQNVCVDSERDIYTLDLVEWALSLGQRPIKRFLPHQQEVLRVKHLRRALNRLAAVRLADEDRHQLSALLRAAVHHGEQRLRERLRPVVGGPLTSVGLQPRNVPERVARAKMIEEVLDRITEHGYLNMGHLRDAVSRNNLKLSDLAGPRELVRGDRLLLTNRRLAGVLDGIYHPGEIYLRWLQRLSSMAFGTPVGRFLTLYVALPFGGSFVILDGLQHMINMVMRPLADTHIHSLARPVPVFLLGALLFALMHVGTVRRQMLKALQAIAFVLRGLFYEWPASFLRLPWVRQILDSRPFRVIRNFLLKPLLLTTLVAGVFPLYGADARTAGIGCGLLYVTASLLLNTRPGLLVQETVLDALVRTWLRFHVDVFPALYRFIMDLFKQLVEGSERLLYVVDEWLRFRSGESRFSLIAKTALGLVWFGVTYVARIYINLLIEPTLNPIKHFPVVTVSAKLILPFIAPLEIYLAHLFMPLGPWVAHGVATLHVILIPGVFGFLVWELKENWRLYEANRPASLRPVMIGHHGEPLPRLLKPGFHSGTLPRLYARLRRAARQATATGNWTAARRYREALGNLEENVRHWVERELIELLAESHCWGNQRLTVGTLCLSCNRITVELSCPGLDTERLRLAFEERSGWLVASIARPGWLPRLSQKQRAAFGAALTGLYKRGGVDLIREQLAAALDLPATAYHLSEEGLVLVPGDSSATATVYPLRDGPVQLDSRPPIPSRRLVFREVPVLWSHWVAAWEADQAGKEPPLPFLNGVEVLPPTGERGL
jgi:hypothetical protein